jgi:hypothetical protein
MPSTWKYVSSSNDENIKRIYCQVLELIPLKYNFVIKMKDGTLINLLDSKYYFDLFTEKDFVTLNIAIMKAEELNITRQIILNESDKVKYPKIIKKNNCNNCNNCNIL